MMKEKKQISINIITNVISYIISLSITFFLTPYLIDTLGMEQYGFFPLASSIISYSSLVIVTVNSMANRFISISYHKGENEQAQAYFNTVLFADIALAIIMAVFGISAIIFLEKLINIPKELISNVKWLFLLMFLSSMLVLAFSVFKTCTFVKNRIDINAYVDIIKPIIRAVVLIVLFAFFVPKLEYVGIAAFTIESIEAFSYLFIKKKILPDIQIGSMFFSFVKLKELVKAGSWNLLARINNILFMGLDLLIANILLGPLASATLGLAKSLPTYVISLLGIVNASFTPTLTKTYSQNEEKLFDDLKVSFIPLTLIGSLLIGGIISVGDIFYSLWVPEQDIKALYILTLLTLSYVFLSYGFGSIPSIYVIKNKLKQITIANTIASISTIITLFILLKYTSLGVYAIAGVSSLFITLKLLFFIALYAAKMLKQKWYTIYLYILRNALCLAIVCGIGYVVKNLFLVDSWLKLFTAAILIAILSTGINFFIVTKRNQRKLIYDKINSRIFKR